MRRLLLALGYVVLTATSAAAHTFIDPPVAAPGSVITVTLNAADERDAASMSKVELFFPENVEVPVREPTAAAAGWVATVFGDRVQWEGPPAEGDQTFTVTLGPLPADPQRLQFLVLQTYDNGDVDRWIEDFPSEGPEPEMPGPILDLVEGAPGTIPDTTAPPATTETSAPETTSTTTTIAPAPAPAPAPPPEDEGSPSGPIIFGIVAVALASGGLYFARRRR